jgi:hypothetical protein
VAVIPGAETGVELADQLSFRLNLRTNGVEKSLARRNKYIMGEMVRNAGKFSTPLFDIKRYPLAIFQLSRCKSGEAGSLH